MNGLLPIYDPFGLNSTWATRDACILLRARVSHSGLLPSFGDAVLLNACLHLERRALAIAHRTYGGNGREYELYEAVKAYEASKAYELDACIAWNKAEYLSDCVLSTTPTRRPSTLTTWCTR
jgi:hypothetical protein